MSKWEPIIFALWAVSFIAIFVMVGYAFGIDAACTNACAERGRSGPVRHADGACHCDEAITVSTGALD